MNSRNFAFSRVSTYVFLYSLICVSSAYLETFYVEDLCNLWTEYTLQLRNGMSGILTSVPTAPDSGVCTIRLKPQIGNSVVLSIYKFNLSPEDQLTITDSDNFTVSLLGKGNFPDERKSFSSKGSMIVRYTWNSTEQLNRRLKFQFVFTEVHEAPCRYDSFQCRNRKCISKSLVCDRHNHCGDNSDQEKCTRSLATEYPQVVTVKSYSRVWMISIIICSAILAIVIIVFVALVIRSNIRRKKKLPPNTPHHDSPPTVTATLPQLPSAPVEIQAPPSVFARFRQSLRGLKSPAAPQPEEPKTDNYEVPSMYPQLPSAPHYSGVENPEFKGDEDN